MSASVSSESSKCALDALRARLAVPVLMDAPPHPIPPPPGGPTPTSWADHQALFLAFISKAWPPKCKLAKNTQRCEIV